jgi:membrane-bound serine protease (ClpP class)
MLLSCRRSVQAARCLAVGAAAWIALGFVPGNLPAQARPVVYVIPIEGIIDMGLAPFGRRILEQAERENAAAVILEINTLGGRLDAAVVLRDALLSSRVPTVAFVNRRAISAGALIALASQRIAMRDGATMGAATPVQFGPGGTAPVDEKSVSYVRTEFRATADSRGRPPDIAEAMVDPHVAIPGLVERERLLTITTVQALQHGMADLTASSIEDLLAQIELSGADVRYTSPNWGENVVRLITHPMVASLLVSVAMLGILIEIRSPGFGVPGALGLGSLALVLGGHWIVELVGWEQLLLVGLGAALLAVEVFVLPGFGIAGLLGIAAVMAAVVTGLVGRGATMGAFAGAAGRVALAIAAALAIAMVIWRYLPKTPLGRRLMLETGLAPGGGDAPSELEKQWLGRSGVTISPLRPAGFAEIDGERIDVVSTGEMIESGAAVVVSRVEGNRVVVRRQRNPAEGAPHD